MSLWAKILIPILVVELITVALDFYRSEEIIYRVELIKCQD